MAQSSFLLTPEQVSPQSSLGKSSKKKSFTIGCIVPFLQSGESKHFLKAFEGFCEVEFHVQALAVGDQASQKEALTLVDKYPKQFLLLEASRVNADMIFSQSHVVLFDRFPSAMMLHKMAHYGVIPIVPGKELPSGFQDFNAQTEKGNLFVYKAGSFWHLVATVFRAHENFKFPYDWGVLRKHFRKAVESYIKIF